MGIILLMLLMNVSVVYSQSDQAIIDELLQKRNRLIAEMNAEIFVKEAFDKAGATKELTTTEKIFTGMDGKVLKEVYDSNGNLLMDDFTNPEHNMTLSTNYTINMGVICRTLLNYEQQDKLRVCNPCPIIALQNNSTLVIQAETLTYGSYQDQTVWDLITGNILRIKVDCCGNIREEIPEISCRTTKKSEVQ